MDLLSGPEWFARVYQRPGEKKTDALMRLAVESGLQIKTLYRVLSEQPVNGKTISMLVGVNGGDRLDVARVSLAGRDAATDAEESDDAPAAEPEPSASEPAA